ncbi:MAG: hypothetical protein WD749_09625 [Phycisphaerales bacterium]
MLKPTLATLFAIVGLAAACHAQTAPVPAPPPAATAPAPTGATGATGPQATIFQAPPTDLPKFDSLIRRGQDGKIIPFDGVVDAHSLLRNPLVTDEDRQRMREAIEDWAADVNQLAIDNLDFLEKVDDDGLIDKLDFNDTNQVRIMNQMMVPLVSAGPLTGRLEKKDMLTPEQSRVNTHISNEYLQALFNEAMGGQVEPIRMDEPGPKQQEKIEHLNKLIQFLYYNMMCRDARMSYHQMLIDAAPRAGEIVASMGLPADLESRLKPAVAASQRASGAEDRKKQVRALLKNLNFDQRRAFLQKAVGLGAARNPVESARAVRAGTAG